MLGPCAGGAVYSPAITDFTIMVDGTSYMFVTGPNVVKTVTHEEIDFEGLGGARVHNETSGVAHFLAAGEADAIDLAPAAGRLLAVEQRRSGAARRRVVAAGSRRRRARRTGAGLGAAGYDMHRVIAGVVDAESFTEVHAHFARNVICGFARVEGRSVGIVAQQPEVLAGVLDIDSSDKAARFVRFCDCFNIPIVTLGRRAGIPARRRPGASAASFATARSCSTPIARRPCRR